MISIKKKKALSFSFAIEFYELPVLEQMFLCLQEMSTIQAIFWHCKTEMNFGKPCNKMISVGV